MSVILQVGTAAADTGRLPCKLGQLVMTFAYELLVESAANDQARWLNITKVVRMKKLKEK